MSESMNISFEHKEEVEKTEGTVAPVGNAIKETLDCNANTVEPAIMPKAEPNDDVDVKPPTFVATKKSKKVKSEPKEDESDFDPTAIAEEDDLSIADTDVSSWNSGPKGGNRKNKRVVSFKQPARYADMHSDSDDGEYGSEFRPRKRYSRACKNKASSKPILDIDIQSSTSPDEFDETVHVMTKERRMLLADQKAAEAAAATAGAQTADACAKETSSNEVAVKVETASEEVEMGSPVKKLKEEPLNTSMESVKDGEHKQEDSLDVAAAAAVDQQVEKKD